jgi:hypothetical protein
MPKLLPDGLPERLSRARHDFEAWADGQAWHFVRGDDYTTTTASFRHHVKRWAKAHGYVAETRPLPATDAHGRPVPLSKTDAVGLAVRLTPARGEGTRAASESNARPREAVAKAA